MVAIVNYGAQTFYYSPTNVLNSVNHNLRVGMTDVATKGKSNFKSVADAFFALDGDRKGGFLVHRIRKVYSRCIRVISNFCRGG